MAQVHYLKTLPVYWEAVARSDKNFEVRKNDRDFQTGDQIYLEYFDPDQGPQNYRNAIAKRISYTLHGGQFGIEPGYVVLGLADLEDTSHD
ncbi:DUF3850 domain-containing protein [Phyllobacterium sp. YR531]|uniref:DUF3850 domain-containing protein n=1 Tax=Phyllobacterium sp. YR531 TaxID=1144343 RepID=UPI00026FBAFD|nr:DUF3850 domain-containing protein [Phyllobacterium sp. YR531]EJN04289.1 hypothetical protein PMI41_01928 [Phyllobacterium sp. YR531]